MSLVSFVKVRENTANSLKNAILESLDLLDYSLPKEAKNVIIKPNMCYYWDYTTGQTTNPKLVAALIELIREKISSNTEISIVESDASAMKCKYAFKFLGYEKLAQDYNVKLINLSEDRSEKVEVKVGNQHFHFMMPQTIKNADLKINIPKIKYLTRTKISCTLKNIFGCNPEPNKFKYHPKLEETIVALNKIMKFNLHILDGIIVTGRQPRRLNLIMASQDPVALDSAASKLADINPKSIRYLTLAYKEGLGNISFVPTGENPKTFEKQFPKKKLKDKILSSTYKFAKRIGLLHVEML